MTLRQARFETLPYESLRCKHRSRTRSSSCETCRAPLDIGNCSQSTPHPCRVCTRAAPKPRNAEKQRSVTQATGVQCCLEGSQPARHLDREGVGSVSLLLFVCLNLPSRGLGFRVHGAALRGRAPRELKRIQRPLLNWNWSLFFNLVLGGVLAPREHGS